MRVVEHGVAYRTQQQPMKTTQTTETHDKQASSLGNFGQRPTGMPT
jgi:hypothetical protein